MRRSSSSIWISPALLLGMLPLLLLVMTCGGGGGGGSGTPSPPPTTGTVTTTITDPPTCKTPNGQFANVWVTITEVRANVSGVASPSDSNWVDLVDLRGSPLQIDLLNLDSTSCLLTQLGSANSVPPGNYQQIRLLLLSNTASAGPAVNHCGGAGFNCVVLADGTVQTLLLSSETQTGIKIPPGQIAGGGFNVAAGGAVNLNIEFDACSSIVQQGNSQFHLKPVLSAGAISPATGFISGRVVDSVSGGSVPNAVVLLEKGDPVNPNIDRTLAVKITDVDGAFTFCGVPPGNFDVVAAATTPLLTTTYHTTVTLQVPSGTAMGNIPLVAEPGGSLAAQISGLITTSATGTLPVPADISVSALQAVGGTSARIVTIPVFNNNPTFGPSTPNVTTDNFFGLCPSGTFCANYALIVPASNPGVGTFSVSPPTFYASPDPGTAVYWVNARALVPMSASVNPGLADCTPSSLPSTLDSTTQLTVTPGNGTSADFAFIGCQ